MIVLPAIDIINGECVRLYQGDYEKKSVVAASYLETAKSFEKAGAEWIHMVDLDAAKSGKPENSKVFESVAKNTNLKVELGGGIRTMETIEKYIDGGISRIVLGSVAIKNPDFVKAAVEKYGDKIAVGIDAKDDYVAANGWLEKSGKYYLDFAKEMEAIGVSDIIYTDISRDGTLGGVSIDKLSKLKDTVNINITASGGVRDIEDIKLCKELNLYGVICGKSLYEGTLNLNEAIKIVNEKSEEK